MRIFWSILRGMLSLPAVLILLGVTVTETWSYKSKNKEVDFNELMVFYISRWNVYLSGKYYPIFEFTISSILWMALFNLIF